MVKKRRALYALKTVATFTILVVGAIGFVLQSSAETPGSRDGEVRPLSGGDFEAWDREGGQWVEPEEFWRRYALRRGGYTWGVRQNTYPPYAQVSEHDTLLVELESGPCLMEFFHRRWRRANDVRRWDEAFNGYGGCPHVFD